MGTIRNPLEWIANQVRNAALHAESAGRAVSGAESASAAEIPQVRRIRVADLGDALAKGLDDFRAFRSYVIFLAIIYPLAGLLLWRIAFHYNMLPLLFPLASGFALVGPAAAVGLYEMSRRRERGETAGWGNAFGALRSPSFGAILMLALILLCILLIWLAVAQAIYTSTLGPQPPISTMAFAQDVFSTSGGWQMILFGTGVGALFAIIVLAISVVSFPLLIDRDVGVVTAILTSVRATRANPVPIAIWGLIVAGGLLLGALPLLVGLIVVVPVLGHATWHLYRKVVKT